MNPVSNGEPLWARARAGERMSREKRLRTGQNRRNDFQRAIQRRAVCEGRMFIGTSDGMNSAVMCRKVAQLIFGVQDFVSMPP